MIRQGLKEEHPSAYQFLDNFHREVEDMIEVMAKFGQDDDVKPREAPEEWVEDNRDKIKSWTEDIEPVDNETIELAYVNWD